MKINYKKLAIAILLTGIVVLLYFYFSFNYVAFKAPLAIGTGKNALATLTYEPSRPEIAGILVFIDRSFYIENSEDNPLKVAVTTKSNPEENFEVSLASLPYKNFTRIYFPKTIVDNNLDPITISFSIGKALKDNEHVNILTRDTNISDKYEEPHLIYHQDLSGIIHEGKMRLSVDDRFSHVYEATMLILLLLILFLYIFDSPENRDQSSTRSGAMSKEIFQAIEDNQGDWWIRARADIIIEILKKYCPRDAKIFDIGAGIGLISQHIQKSGFSSVTPADNSEEALKILKKKGFKPLKIELPKIQVKEKFDAVLLLDVIEHLDADTEALRGVRKILNDKGIAVITVPALPFLWSKKDSDYGHRRRYLKSGFADIIQEAGYSIEYLSYYNFFLFLPAAIFNFLNKKELRVKRYGSWRDRFFYPIFRFEKYFIVRDIGFPFGVSLLAVIKKQN